jgi:hypothetical protein
MKIRERYVEGEIPHEANTGTGPILLTSSYPYVRDWLNEHPFKNEPNARSNKVYLLNFRSHHPRLFADLKAASCKA